MGDQASSSPRTVPGAWDALDFYKGLAGEGLAGETFKARGRIHAAGVGLEGGEAAWRRIRLAWEAIPTANKTKNRST